MRRKVWSWAALPLLVSACTVGPDFKPVHSWSPASWFASRPKPATPPPDDASLPAPEPVDPNWWTLFHDPVLTSLEARVAKGNLDLAIAAPRPCQFLAMQV